jgi:murein DD-endopeptidase MepM/ murein hydrolase activator NlpD
MRKSRQATFIQTRNRRPYFWVILPGVTLMLVWWLTASNASFDEPYRQTEKTPPNPSPSPETAIADLSTSRLAAHLTPAPAIDVPDWLEITIKAGDTLSDLFHKYQLNTDQLQHILSSAHRAHFQSMQDGHYLTVHTDQEGNVNELMLELNFDEELYISRQMTGFNSQIRARPVKTRLISTQAVVTHSLYETAKKHHIPTTFITEMLDIFRWDVDFARSVQAGDVLRVVYEQRQNDSQQQQAGPLLAVEFINRGQSYRAVRYIDPTGGISYYTPEGEGLRKAFLRTPVEYARLTSTFGQRRHPILNRLKQHNGVDYAAPIGTPVMVTGEGTVKTLERQRGYGRVIVISHEGGYQTLYAHLSKFAADLQVGDTVQQGQVIGYVGKSGLATGPHLHYEFHIDGVHHDPLTVKLPNTLPLPKQQQVHFFQQIQPYLAQLAQLDPTPTNSALSTPTQDENTFVAATRYNKPLSMQVLATR